MSDIVNQSGDYPKKHDKPEATHHKDPNGKDIKIVEEISEKIKLGMSGSSHYLIIDNQVLLP